MTLYEVYAICDLCIFGNITRGMLKRFLFLHCLAPTIRRSFIYIWSVFIIVFYLCIIQRIWRGRLPGVCESGALTTLVIPSRDCPPLVIIIFLPTVPANFGTVPLRNGKWEKLATHICECFRQSSLIDHYPITC